MQIITSKFFLNFHLFFLFVSSPIHASLEYYYSNQTPTYNSFGSIGLINTTTAEVLNDGNLNFVYTRNNIYQYGAIVLNPFNFLEAAYFYYRPSDLWWTTKGTEGLYLDKGFNIKFSRKFKNMTVAIGLDDFAGTGLFSREYLVSTLNGQNYKASLGIGWGVFAGSNKFSNPLGSISQSFNFRERRDQSSYKLGGNPSYSSWFRGPVNYFGGVELFSQKIRNLSYKIEYDPFDYVYGITTNGYYQGQNLKQRESTSRINYGINYKLSNSISITISKFKGNTFNFTFTIGADFSKTFFRKDLPKPSAFDSKKGNSAQDSFYEDLIYNINKKSIYLQSAELSSKDLKVAIASSKYRNPIHSHVVLGETIQAVKNNHQIVIDTVTTIGTNVGHELYQITSPLEAFISRKDSIPELVYKQSNLQAGDSERYKSLKFRPTIKYPASFTGITPALVNHIGDPVKFYYGGIVLRLDNEIQFSSRLQLNTEIHQNLTNNFDEKRNFPDSLLPRVRTDIVSYLQESDTYISSMQLDYFFNPYKEVFGKFSAGILENMYAGAGVEFLYKPFEQNFSIGLEAYRAKKRAFDRKFELLDYEINTGHINFNYHLPQWGILGTLSYGKYLAGDEGYTFDISRRLPSGFRTGVFFTRTNVSAELFGEGSFDKGFYFQIPIDLFLNDYRGGYINFKLRPLTRDGGQKLEAGNDLIGLMHTTSRAEIERDWGSFND